MQIYFRMMIVILFFALTYRCALKPSTSVVRRFTHPTQYPLASGGIIYL